jgi:hypothetical protein
VGGGDEGQQQDGDEQQASQGGKAGPVEKSSHF